MFALLIALVTGQAQAQDWWDDAWSKRIGMDMLNAQQASDLTDFPVLVVLNSARINYGDTNDDGSDIRFVDSDGTELLHQIEYWNEAGSSYVWVAIPTVDGGSDTDNFWMYYGNPAASDISTENTWNNDFMSVFHLDGDGSNEGIDNAGNNDSQGNSNLGSNVGCHIGRCYDWAGSDPHIYWPQSDFGSFNDITVSAWFRVDAFDTAYQTLMFMSNESNVRIRRDNQTDNIEFVSQHGASDKRLRGSVDVNDGNWHHVVATFDNSTDAKVLYIDGAVDASTTESGDLESMNNWSGLGIAYTSSSGRHRHWDGPLDEFRIMTQPMTADWVAAEFLTGDDQFLDFWCTDNTDNDGDGTRCSLDCDDDNAAVHPGATEVTCDGVDNDCDPSTLDQAPVELCGDGVDNDCDANVDDIGTWFQDLDGDTYGDPSWSIVSNCQAADPVGFVANADDCWDADATVHPDGLDDSCNGLDDDCNGSIDDGLTCSPASSGTCTRHDWEDSVYIVCTGTANWGTNWSRCQAIPGGYYHMATVQSPGENAFLDDAIGGDSWIGYFDPDSNNTWYWADGSATTYTTWESGDPDDGSGDCARMETDGDWDDRNCGDANRVVCEVDCFEYYEDWDSDGYGDPLFFVRSCTGAPAGYVGNDADCDDLDPAVTVPDWYLDADGDGYGDENASATHECTQPTGSVADNTDCDDADGLTYPAATELCDGADNNCNSAIDEGSSFTWFLDFDGDNYGDVNNTTTTSDCNTKPPGYSANYADCDDVDVDINPMGTETCDGRDEDCDGSVDEGGACSVASCVQRYNGDSTYLFCTSDITWNAASDRCASFGYHLVTIDDANENTWLTSQGLVYDNWIGINDKASEGNYVWEDGTTVGYTNWDSGEPDSNDCMYMNDTTSWRWRDWECDSGIADYICEAEGCRWYLDGDGDGLGDPLVHTSDCATQPVGYVGNPDDCDDSNASLPSLYYADVDGDGFGDRNAGGTYACGAGGGLVPDNTDCDDTEILTYPGAPERCDGEDNDCDGATDEGVQTFYQDTDGDGWGDALTGISSDCASVPGGYVPLSGDCDEGDVDVNPGESEACDAKDNNCDGEIDEGNPCPNCTTYTRNSSTYQVCTPDGWWTTAQAACDGWGYNLAKVEDQAETTYLSGLVGNSGDYFIGLTDPELDGSWVWEDGTAVTDYYWNSGEPGGSQRCSMIRTSANAWHDIDCTNQTENGYICELDCVAKDYYQDLDGDGFGNNAVAQSSCGAPGGYVSDNTDCNDNASDVYPGNTSVGIVGNSVDNDCDPSTRDECYVDNDQDGVGGQSGSIVQDDGDNNCNALGESDLATDCNDSDPTLFPGNNDPSVVTDAGDNDCDGFNECFADSDGDGKGGTAAAVVNDTGGDGCQGGQNESLTSDDCDDADATVYPGNSDPSIVDNAKDNTCDGHDECFIDGDGDGYGSSLELITEDTGDDGCLDTQLESTVATDCADGDAGVFPGNTDPAIVALAGDQDCDGHAECFLDADGDGRGTDAGTIANDVDDDGCNAAQNESPGMSDCDDGDATVFPGNTDPAIVGNGVDNTCDATDECFVDNDNDGRGGQVGAIVEDDGDGLCDDAGESIHRDDCADSDPNRFPGNTNPSIVDNGIDNTCSGTDECFADADMDGHGTDQQTIDEDDGDDGCNAVDGESDIDDDCNDGDPDVYPGNTDPSIVGNGADNTCDANDECFGDGDGDGYGNSTVIEDDGDGVCDDSGESATQNDCDDTNAAIFPGNSDPSVVATAGDDDCDGAEECFADIDMDGHAAETTPAVIADTGTVGCLASEGESTIADDCDDADADRYPGNNDPSIVENGVDNTCDAQNRDECFQDFDGDTFAGSSAGLLEDDGDGFCDDVGEAATADDCDDNNADIYPSAPIDTSPGGDVGNGVDDDCDGTGRDECFFDGDQDGHADSGAAVNQDVGNVGCQSQENEAAFNDDCDDADGTRWQQADWYPDVDGDGFGDVTASPTSSCGAPDTVHPWVTDTGNITDCDDTSGSIKPGAFEIVGDEIDQNCDGQEDCFLDQDQDGYGNDFGSTVTSTDVDCDDPGESSSQDDCVDDPSTVITNASGGAVATNTIHPGATEIPSDEVDLDCNGTELCWSDQDEDGYGSDQGATVLSSDLVCTDARESLNDLDCDDTRDDVNPDTVWYADADTDTFGNDAVTQVQCTQPNGYVRDNTDCDDSDVAINPNTLWYPDGDGDGYGTGTFVQQCDQPAGHVLPGNDCNDLDDRINPDTIWYEDIDGDGFGDSTVTITQCATPAGYVLTAGDCDINDPVLNPDTEWYLDADGDTYGDPNDLTVQCAQPSSSHVLNDLDCDDTAGSGFDINPDTEWFRDADGDTFGNANNSTNQCLQPNGYVRDDTDCDDAEVLINPDTAWYTDGDQDGYGDENDTNPTVTCVAPLDTSLDNTDCNDGDAAINPATAWYADTDSDGFGDAGDRVFSCTQPTGYVLDNSDCDDTDNGVGAGTRYYRDDDGDGYGDPGTVSADCNDPDGGGNTWILDSSDCDDGDAAINPNATEVCNGDDDDCDTITDEPDAQDAQDWVEDADLDGYGVESTLVHRCNAPNGYIVWSGNSADNDCNDLVATTHPNATDDECTDGIDNDCDGSGRAVDDSDGDGLTWNVENAAGSSDCTDDSDGDTVLDGAEYGGGAVARDTDQDGTPDIMDDDDDNDGVPTSVEGGTANTDSDSLPDYRDADDDDDGIPTSIERTAGDTDNDNVDNYLDADDDDDGIDTADELAWNADHLDIDTDGDGLSDFEEWGTYPGEPRDTDGDGVRDILDTDDDGDGLLTSDELGWGSDPLLKDSDGDSLEDGTELNDGGTGTPGNTDNDGLIDMLDPDDDDDGRDTIDERANGFDPYDSDSDGDGIDDDTEWGPNAVPRDTDNDGTADGLDPDDDNDGVNTIDETRVNSLPLNPDSDGDSVPDGVEWGGDPTTDAPADTDLDGTIDILDTDDDQDGVLTIDEEAAGTNRFDRDSDGDSFDDFIEFAGQSIPPDTDSDGISDPLDDDDDDDGILSFEEGGQDIDCDANGVPVGDGIPNYLDPDDDGDGDPTAIEGTGDADGDGVPNWLDCNDFGCTGDSDGDGIDNCTEDTWGLDPSNPDTDGDGIDDGTEWGPGIDPQDTDMDNTIDGLDTDDDGDGVATREEMQCVAPGPNVDLAAERPTYDDVTMTWSCPNGNTPTVRDTDGDTIPDYLDDDDDGDGVPTDQEDVNGGTEGVWDDDVDGDLIPDFLDDDHYDGKLGDADGDGILNGDEIDAQSDPYSDDSDGDGIPDGVEWGDGDEPQDTDGDRIPDVIDDDDDGDGVPTVEEGVIDHDLDGDPDYLDEDSDDDGVADGNETLDDVDCDGLPDRFDADDADTIACNEDTGQVGTDGNPWPDKPECGCSAASGTTPSMLWLGLAALVLRRRNGV